MGLEPHQPEHSSPSPAGSLCPHPLVYTLPLPQNAEHTGPFLPVTSPACAHVSSPAGPSLQAQPKRGIKAFLSMLAITQPPDT